jgi:chromosome segregation ATPase
MITTTSLFNAEGADARSLEILVQAIEKNNLPGFDYFEFKRAVAALKEAGQDEATAYKSAFTTAATLGITKEKLIETASYYRNLLQKEQDNFKDALQHQTRTKVTQPQTELQRLQDQIERHRAEITRLQDEVAKYLEQVDATQASIKSETDKIANTQKGFESTLAAVQRIIDSDVEALHKHLA